MRKIPRENPGIMRPGQDLAVAGYAGVGGTCRLRDDCREQLSRWFTNEYLDDIKQLPMPVLNPEPAWLQSVGVTEYEPVGEGGIYAALWTLSGGHGQGFGIDPRAIPFRQQTIEVCERLGLNPYALMSGNCLLLVADNGGATVRKLAEQGIPAAVIGCVNPGIKRELYHQDGVGYMERPGEDELWRVLQKPENGS